jgi:mannose-6-phosphate isomerase-like protein (cupin superfamily)
MKIVDASTLHADRIVDCPKGGFTSNRILLEEDGMGYSMTKTIVYAGPPQRWHYKNHLESCYCVSGSGVVTNEITGERYEIKPDVTYVLDKHDPHIFEAYEDVTLICVFNPPLIGREVHDESGSYMATEFRSPVYAVRSVPIEKVTANDYNPNSVAPPEMALLETSIWEDGYTQPVVVVYDQDNDKYVVVDGFHRYLTLKNSSRINERERGRLPVVVLDKQMHDRMASTIRHNRARGAHNIELMSNIVAELVEMGKGDRWICQHIGMSADELLRLKQITGVAALFQNREFSNSWEAEESFDDEI